MTIGTTAARVSFNCNGVTTVFPVPTQAYLAADFLVLATNTTTGAVTTLVLNSDYTLVATGTLSPPAWTLTTLTSQLTSPYATGITLQVILNPVETQQTQYVQGQAFPSLAVQTNVDRLTQMVQRLSDLGGRTIRQPDGDVTAWGTLPNAAARANTALSFDNNGLPTLGVLASSTVTQGTITNLLSGVAYTALANAAAPIVMTQNYNYGGGSAGFVVPVLNLVANVTNCGNNFAWTLLAVMNNSSPTGQNVAFFAQGTSVVSTAGPTWSATFEGRDLSGAANPTVGRVSVEIDRRDNGTDTNLSRVALDVVCTRPLVGGAFTGAAATIAYAVRVGSFGDSGTTIGAAYTVFSTNVGFGLDVANATVISGAVRMANSVPILFDISGTLGATINSLQGNAGSGLDHRVSGVVANRLLQTGGIFMVGPSHTIVLNAVTGASSGTTPVLTANKPGAGTAIGSWISWQIDGSQYWVPAWAN